MLEKALKGSKGYAFWIVALLAIIVIGGIFYLQQLFYGLGLTGMSRDVSWGLYIAQFTFLVGIAASAVMLVLPYYLHDHKAFGRITILGEFLAVAAIIMCISFVIVDLGRPDRVFNLLLHPTPNSILFWDMVVLSGYFLLNIVIGWVVLNAERNEVPPPGWVKPLIYLSIPWAVSIHTVTAFLISGMAGRGFWNTAIMAPRFLASAFASGPALLILFAYVIRRFAGFDAGRQAIQSLAKIVTYAMVISLFFLGCEFFTVFYTQIPDHMNHFIYLYRGIGDGSNLVPFAWLSGITGILATILLLVPKTRNNPKILGAACILVFLSLWIEKGFALIIAGFIPSPMEKIMEYAPSGVEIMITLGVWALGLLILTLLYKIAISVKQELEL